MTEERPARGKDYWPTLGYRILLAYLALRLAKSGNCAEVWTSISEDATLLESLKVGHSCPKGIGWGVAGSSRFAFLGAFLSIQLFSATLRAQDIPREQALQQFEELAASVREHMNSDPGQVEENLTYGLARSVGDDPRVLKLCEEVILKSTNPHSVAEAVGAIAVIEAWHTPLYALKRRKELAAILMTVLERDNIKASMSAAGVLFDMGLRYRRAARAFYIKVLKVPPANKSEVETKRLLAEVVRQLLSDQASGDLPAIRMVTEKFDLIEYVEAQIGGMKNPATRQTYEELLKKWRAIMER